MNNLKDTDWNMTLNGEGELLVVPSAIPVIALLSDIREELRELNQNFKAKSFEKTAQPGIEPKRGKE